MKKKILLSLVLLTGAVVALGAKARSQTSKTPAHAPVVFPPVSGRNLAGTRFALPADFAGERNIVLMAFTREQQSEIDTWLPVAKRLEATHPKLRYYEVPTLARLPQMAQTFIDNGMRSGISDKTARERTITVYINKEPFRRALGMTTETSIYALLVDRQGHVLWQASGVWTQEKEAGLANALKG